MRTPPSCITDTSQVRTPHSCGHLLLTDISLLCTHPNTKFPCCGHLHVAYYGHLIITNISLVGVFFLLTQIKTLIRIGVTEKSCSKHLNNK
jgi:hypothetical protein